MQGGDKYRFLNRFSVSNCSFLYKSSMPDMFRVPCNRIYNNVTFFLKKKSSAEIAFIANFIKIIPLDSVADPVGAGKSDLIP